MGTEGPWPGTLYKLIGICPFSFVVAVAFEAAIAREPHLLLGDCKETASCTLRERVFLP